MGQGRSIKTGLPVLVTTPCALVRGVLVFSTILFLSGLFSGATVADEQPPAEKAAPPTEGRLLLELADGTRVPLSELGVSDSVLEDLIRRSGQQQGIPLFDIAQLELEADVDQGIFRATLDLKINVLPEEEWIAVPMDLPETHVADFRHLPSDEGQKGLFDHQRGSGRRWLLYGAGLHSVRLNIVGRVRTPGAGRRALALSLPEATASHARFSFPEDVRPDPFPESVVTEVTTTEDGGTLLEIWGLPAASQVGWRRVQPTVKSTPVLQSSSRMTLDLSTIPASLSCRQTIDLLSGQADGLTVRIPSSYRVVSLGGRDETGTPLPLKFERKEVDQQTAEIVIDPGTLLTASTELQWLLEDASAADVDSMRVHLPRLAQSALQSGDLDILVPQGLLIRQVETQGLQRRRVVSDSDRSSAVTAFRLLSEESELTMRVEEIEASYSVTPEFVLRTEGNSLVLSATFSMNVLRGSLLESRFTWDQFTQEGWQFVPGSERLTAGSTEVPVLLSQPDEQEDEWVVQFPERQAGRILLRFSAFLPFLPDQTVDTPIRFPQVIGGVRQPAVVMTADSDEYSLEPTPDLPAETLTKLPDRSRISSVQEEVPEELLRAWLGTADISGVRLSVVEQTPTVEVVAEAGLSPRDDGIHVREVLEFTVTHRDLRTVTLLIPPGIQPEIRWRQTGALLRPILETERRWSYALPGPVRGTFVLTADYLLPGTGANRAVDPGAEATALEVPLPLILPADERIPTILIGTNTPGALRLASGDLLQSVYSDHFAAAWNVSTDRQQTLTVDYQPAPATQQQLPDLLLVHSQMAGPLVLTHVTAWYRSLPDELTVRSRKAAQSAPVVQLNGQETALQKQAGDNPRWDEWIVRLAETAPIPLSSRSIEDGPGTDGEALASESESAGAGSITPDPGEASADVSERTPVGSWFRVDIFSRSAADPQSRLLSEWSVDHPRPAGPLDSVPLIWILETSGDRRIITSDSFLHSVSTSSYPVTNMPGSDGADQSAGETGELIPLEGLVDSLPESMRADIRQSVSAKKQTTGTNVVLFGPARISETRVWLVPGVTLLLTAGVVMVLAFLLFSRVPRLLNPHFLFIGAIAGAALWVLVPRPAVTFVPPAAAGLIVGYFGAALQAVLNRKWLPPDSVSTYGFSGVFSVPPTTVIRGKNPVGTDSASGPKPAG